MKKIDPVLEQSLGQIARKMEADGYEGLLPYVLEKDALVTEMINSVAAAVTHKDYSAVFCGGTCLSKAHKAFDRMSEDVDFKIVRPGGFADLSKSQLRKDLSQLKGMMAQCLENLGYSPDDLKITARDSNQYVSIDAHYASRFGRNQSMRTPIKLELNATTLQLAPTQRPVARIVDPWLHESMRAATSNVACVSLIEAMAEKLIAFPRRLAHYHSRAAQGVDQAAFDHTLVRHLYDVTMLGHKTVHSHRYPGPYYLTADCLLEVNEHILLVRRGGVIGHGQLALPGGFLDAGETLYQGALRELEEETGLGMFQSRIDSALVADAIFDHPQRSPRGRLITRAFHFKMQLADLPVVRGMDDAQDAFWAPIGGLAEIENELFEDHATIIDRFIPFLS